MNPKTNRLILFGAGSGGTTCLETVEDNFEIIAFADNDSNKQRTLFHGYPVIAPHEIQHYQFDYILLSSMNYMQIRRQLTEDLHISDDRQNCPF